jgi:hypothetical protein
MHAHGLSRRRHTQRRRLAAKLSGEGGNPNLRRETVTALAACPYFDDVSPVPLLTLRLQVFMPTVAGPFEGRVLLVQDGQ